MSDQVINFPGITRLDMPAERVLQAALDEGLDSVVIIGYDKFGEEYFASSQANGGDTLWLLERAKLILLQALDE